MCLTYPLADSLCRSCRYSDLLEQIVEEQLGFAMHTFSIEQCSVFVSCPFLKHTDFEGVLLA